MKQVRVLVKRAPLAPVPVNVNGRRIAVPVGIETDIPITHLDALKSANGVECVVLAKDKAEAATSETEAVPYALLDRPTKEIVAVLDGLDQKTLGALLDAEKQGKTRKSVVKAIEARLVADT